MCQPIRQVKSHWRKKERKNNDFFFFKYFQNEHGASNICWIKLPRVHQQSYSLFNPLTPSFLQSENKQTKMFFSSKCPLSLTQNLKKNPFAQAHGWEGIHELVTGFKNKMHILGQGNYAVL
jgi:hypothetical protein